MAISFLSKSRHGSVYYFRRRVPNDLRPCIGKPYLVKSLNTYEKRTAIILARSLAARTDEIFIRLRNMANRSRGNELYADFTLEIDLNEFGKPSRIRVEAESHEQEAVSAVVSALRAGESVVPAAPAKALKPFNSAIDEYFEKVEGIKPTSKANYRSKFRHAQDFFGATHDVLTVEQLNLVAYSDHVRKTIQNETTRGLYIQAVASFINWHRIRAGKPSLTTKTLIPKRRTPESSDRDSYSIDQMAVLFKNAAQYRETEPHKWWATVAVAFLGCRIEELAQVNIATDLVYDQGANIWYFKFDEAPDEDGDTKKSIKKPTSWRRAPIHSALVRHGFIEYLENQRKLGASRPFELGWKPRIAEDEGIHKWSHYISRWGGKELALLNENGLLPKGKRTYFHSMRHSFSGLLRDSGISPELVEALCGRRSGGSDEERYGKVKENHVRLSQQGIEPGLDKLVSALEKAYG